MTAFADASAIVKLYAEEPGSDAMSARDVIVVSAISRVEVTAALWRKHRIGDLSPTEARVLVDAFLADWAATSGDTPAYVPVAVGPAVLDTAVALCGVHGLRAYDAVQLASAVQARDADPAIDAFLAADVALVRAAAAAGFDVPELA